MLMTSAKAKTDVFLWLDGRARGVQVSKGNCLVGQCLSLFYLVSGEGCKPGCHHVFSTYEQVYFRQFKKGWRGWKKMNRWKNEVLSISLSLSLSHSLSLSLSLYIYIYKEVMRKKYVRRGSFV